MPANQNGCTTLRYIRSPACTTLVYIDDATSALMQLRFVKSESTFSYFDATRGYIEKHGKPLALYSDNASIFRVNNKNATKGDGHTQFGRAMHDLNIQAICAETSSAKGRVERARLTLQDRLVKELDSKVSATWMMQMVQDKRDNTHSQAVPAGNGPSRRHKEPIEKKPQRALNQDDMLEALTKLQTRSEEIFGSKV